MKSPLTSHRQRLGIVLTLGTATLLALCVFSLAVGSRMIAPTDALNGFLYPANTTDSLIVWKLRVPRTLTALLVGAALATAGALMQSLTHNPLAEPGILGINSGAAVWVVSGIALLSVTGPLGQLWLALIGSGLAATAVFLIGTSRTHSVMDKTSRLLLSGVALNACLSAITGIITMFNSRAFDSYRFWVVGSMERQNMEALASALPFTLVGLALAFTLIRPLGALSLGEDAAASLGVPVPLIQGATLLAITLLCGSATAIAGPISFVGLVVPHVLRLLVGPGLPSLIPFSLIGGPVLVLGADIIGRVIAIPAEVEAGIVTAFIGAPVLLLLVLRLNSTGKRLTRSRRERTPT